MVWNERRVVGKDVGRDVRKERRIGVRREGGREGHEEEGGREVVAGFSTFSAADMRNICVVYLRAIQA